MTEYFQVARHLGMVRRAWKRNEALAGLAIVCIESVGILTVALLIDWIYQPMPAVRLGMFLIVLAAVGVLVARHVARPLMRRISDDQLALFVEEHSEQFEGALITAAELESHPEHGQAPQQIVDAVMRAAAARARGTSPRSVIDLRRLHKYAVAAVLLLAGYGAMCLAFPETVGRHASRVLVPWQKAKEDLRNNPFVAGMDPKLPIQFTLNKGDIRLLRRGTFDLQAALSRAGDEPVMLNFRPAGQPNLPWREVAMKEIERVNTYAAALPDVDEDLEYCVSCGPDRSGVYKVGVYDPLKVEGFEITTQYPAYLQIPQRVEVVPTGDLVVPAGSKVQVRILASAALTKATLTWQDGTAAPMTLENQGKGSAVAAFEVNQDTSYTYAVMDADGQREEGLSSCMVRALPDGPPTVEVKYPTQTVTANPLGEVTFNAEAIDDLALAGVDVVYERQLPMDAAGQTPPAKTGRVPMALKRAAPTTGPAYSRFPDVAQAGLRFALEELEPPVAPEEIISYYLEVTDRKGLKTVSDIQMVVVDRFDTWPRFDPAPPHGPTYKIVKNITEYLQAAWKLDQMRPVMPPEEFVRQARGLADSMVDPESKRLYPFYERKKVPPSKVAHADRADRFIESGHKALEGADTAKAVSDFRVVLAELTILKLDKMGIEMFTGDFGKKGAPQDFEKDLKKLFQQVTIEVDKVMPPPGWDPKESKAVEKIKKAAEELAKQQADVVKKAEEIAKAGGANENKPADPQAKDEDKDNQKAAAQAEKDAKALAGEQEKVAAETHKEAMENKADAPKDPDVKNLAGRMEDAAKTMRDAQRNMQDNKMEAAVADAKRAQAELTKVAERLENLRQEKLAAAVGEAEARAAKLLKEQKDVTRETEGTAAKDANAPEDQKEREYKKLAYRQAQVQVQAEQFKKDVEELSNWAQRDARMDTAKHIEETNRQMSRGEVDQKMVNAVVELNARSGQTAVPEQKKAERGLEAVLTALRKAGDSLAADREAQLQRAKEEARRIDEGLEKLGAAVPTTQVAKSPATTGPAAASQPALAANDPAPQQNDPNSRENPDGNKTPATQPTAKNPDDRGKPEDAKPLTDREKKELAEDLAYEMERLARHLEDRDFAEKPDQQHLSAITRDTGRLTNEMLNDKTRRNDTATVVRRVRDKLEAEYRTQLESKRLLDAQREECPPSYRQVVNRYYEALSESAK